MLLVPAESAVLPNDVATATRLTPTIALEIPIVSAAMDTVTEARLAIALARQGGLGIIHRNLAIEHQVAEVDRVKRSEAGMIVEPVTLGPDDLVADALELMARYRVSGVPITNPDGVLVGILTNRDLRFGARPDQRTGELMTSENLVTARVGTTLAEAEALLGQHKIEKLPIVDDAGAPPGADHRQGHPEARALPARDQGRARTPARGRSGRRRHGCARACCSPGRGRGRRAGRRHRARALARRRRDGAADQGGVRHRAHRRQHRHRRGGRGADRCRRRCLKAGVGPGSICTTRVVAGVGVPQVTAVFDVAEVAIRHGIPVIADGGITSSGDVAKAIAAGADTVMLGSMLAGTDESPGDVILVQGERFKEYRGMGSLGAMKARSFSKDRYFQGDVEDVDKLVPEGIEGRVLYKGPLAPIVYQLVGGLRQAMGYCGARRSRR